MKKEARDGRGRNGFQKKEKMFSMPNLAVFKDL